MGAVFPLGGAHSYGWPKVTDHAKVIEIAAEIAVTPSQLGLAWLIAHRRNILLIPGTASVSHLQENIASAARSLGDDILSALDVLGAATIESINGEA